jgi:hypothetical protein
VAVILMNKTIQVLAVLLIIVGFALLAGLVVGDSSHGGDFTWRQQAMIGALRAPVYALGSTLAALVLVQACRRRGERGGQAKWFLAAGLVACCGLTVALFVHPLDSAIMMWNANVPPADWHVVREQRIIAYVVALISGALALLAVVRASYEAVPTP